MITRPLDLAARLSRPPRDLDVLHWVSLAGILLFFSLAGSRFVLAPGLLLGRGAGEFTLPRHGAGTQLLRTAPVVLSFRRDNVILFGGGVYKRLEELRGPLQTQAREHPGALLLVLADQQVSITSVARLTELAMEAGFAGVQLAGRTEPVAPAGPGLLAP